MRCDGMGSVRRSDSRHLAVEGYRTVSRIPAERTRAITCSAVEFGQTPCDVHAVLRMQTLKTMERIPCPVRLEYHSWDGIFAKHGGQAMTATLGVHESFLCVVGNEKVNSPLGYALAPNTGGQLAVQPTISTSISLAVPLSLALVGIRHRWMPETLGACIRARAMGIVRIGQAHVGHVAAYADGKLSLRVIGWVHSTCMCSAMTTRLVC